MPLVAEPEPILTFAPATIANLGPGFGFLGCAIDGLGDFVSVMVDPTIPPASSAFSKSPTSSHLPRNFPKTLFTTVKHRNHCRYDAA